ncbi:MAG: addiction module protein [Candidatus Binatia bacterium]
MSESTKDLEAELLSLPPDRRTRIAERLIDSLELDWEEDVDGQWIAEAERRLDELEVRRTYLESRSRFYIGSWHHKSCAKLDASRFSGVVEETCCDTVPVSGTCALDGPVVTPAP